MLEFLFKRKPRNNVRYEYRRYLSDILVNDSNGEERLGVIDYTFNPIDLQIDLQNDSYSEGDFFAKVCGKIISLNFSPIRYSNGIYYSLPYEGMLQLKEDFLLFFQYHRDHTENPNLKFEETLLEAGKSSPIIMIGRISRGSNPGIPYSLDPFVLRLGDYTCPAPRRRGEEPRMIRVPVYD